MHQAEDIIPLCILQSNIDLLSGHGPIAANCEPSIPNICGTSCFRNCWANRSCRGYYCTCKSRLAPFLFGPTLSLEEKHVPLLCFSDKNLSWNHLWLQDHAVEWSALVSHLVKSLFPSGERSCSAADFGQMYPGSEHRHTQWPDVPPAVSNRSDSILLRLNILRKPDISVIDSDIGIKVLTSLPRWPSRASRRPWKAGKRGW